jgi:uncharacterized protein YqhQ
VTAHTAAEEEQPQTCTPGEHAFGGQAVIEGVMMRGRHSWGVAVRRPAGDIARVAYPLPQAGSRNKILRFPVIRGVVALYESMSLGIRALGLSANISLEGLTEAEAAEKRAAVEAAAGVAGAEAAPSEVVEVDEQPPAFGWKQLAVTVVIALGMTVALFIVVPLVVAKSLGDALSNPILFNLVEGLIRIAIFILYLVGISLIPDLRKVFEYHGAEHKLIHAYEACGRPDAALAKKFTTRHPRCGTGFLLLVFVLAVFLFALVGRPSVPWLVLSRIVGIPIIVGIGYELGIKWAGRSNRLWARIILWPGIQLQRLTTREPSDAQLEVAAAALEEVIAMDQAEVAAQKEALATA